MINFYQPHFVDPVKNLVWVWPASQNKIKSLGKFPLLIRNAAKILQQQHLHKSLSCPHEQWFARIGMVVSQLSRGPPPTAVIIFIVMFSFETLAALM